MLNRTIILSLIISLLALVYAGFQVVETTKSLEITWMDMPVNDSIIHLVDDRDYPEDAYEVYLMGKHIGQYYADQKEFEYKPSGK